MNKKISRRLSYQNLKMLPEGCYDGSFSYIDISNDSNRLNQTRYKLWRFIALTFFSILVVIASIFVSLLLNYDISLEKIPDIEMGLEALSGILIPSKETVSANAGITHDETKKEETDVSITADSIYDFDYSKVQTGYIPIIPKDLSLISYGNKYIHNNTGLAPDIEALMEYDFKRNSILSHGYSSTNPLILIVHTHSTEAYFETETISYQDTGAELFRSNDKEKNVLAVGDVLSAKLNALGISTVHCEIAHDSEGYGSAYSRAENTIRKYLEQYPSIKLVIDLHRDAIINSNNELIRPVSVYDNKSIAQVMCVVGSSWGGQENPNWEKNLALALALRNELNTVGKNICRPPYLKSSTYNQELAEYSLLIEVGAAGNSIEESCRAAELIAIALSKII